MLACSVALALLPPTVADAAEQGLTRPPPPPLLVTITDEGFDPQTVSPVVGQTIHFDNLAGRAVTVRATTGAFDSGAIPVGGAFSVIVPVAGSYPFTSPELAKEGALHVGLLDIPGAGSDRARDRLPDVSTPPDSTFDVHPTLTIHASRTRALVLLSESATVEQVNTALALAGVTVVGTLPSIGVLVVAVADDGPGEFAAIDEALVSLRGQPGVDAAALSTPGNVDAIPQPPEQAMVTRGASNWQWRHVENTDNSSPGGDGGNWGMESSRFPFAWNLNDAVYAKNAAVHTAVLDEGFSSHPDLGGTMVRLCVGTFSPDCNSNGSGDHGTHVAGTIGARWDNTSSTGANRSVGVSGGNPVADLRLIPWGGIDLMVLLSRALTEKRPGTSLEHLRVLNLSGTHNGLARDPAPDGSPSGAVGPYEWGRVWANRLCGPGPADDTTVRTVPCTPDTEDAILRSTAEMGAIARAVAEDAARREVNLVVSTGNDSDGICAPPVSQPPCRAGSSFVQLDSRKRHPLAWASASWQAGSANPIILVEAIDQARRRASFSNVGGDVSAPGVDVLSTVPATKDATTYASYGGTSMAAPHVTALASYLLEYNPDLTAAQVKQLIVGHARADTSGGAKPRIDAYSSILAVPGAAKAIVDVNDPSLDGNRREVLTDDGTEQLDTLSGRGRFGRPTFSEPDGRVDMRDFRRFRDAWLQVCQSRTTPGGGCPTASNIVLDGDTRFPKKDLNLDRCVYDPDPALGCSQTLEQSFSRFDFNGDGRIGLDEYPVSLNPDGTPTSSGNNWAPSDLAMLQKYFETSTTLTEGWSADALNGLLTSADVEVHADAFFAAGVDSVDVTVEDRHTGTWVEGPARTLREDDPVMVATQPVGANGGEVRVRAEATVAGRTVKSAPVTVTMKPGQDARVDLCVPTVEVKPDDRTLFTRADGVRVRLSLALCPSDQPGAGSTPPRPGRSTIGLSLRTRDDPAAPAGLLDHEPPSATLSETTVVTDEAGEAIVELAPGVDPELLTIDAVSELSVEGIAEPVLALGSADLDIADPPRLIYRYEQLTTDWNYQHTALRSNGGVDDRIDRTESAAALPYRIERSGALTPTSSGGAKLTETVSGDDLLANVNISSSVNGTRQFTERTFVYPSQTTKTDVDVSFPNILIDSYAPNGLPRADVNWFGGLFSEISEDRNLVSFWQLEDLEGVQYPYGQQDASLPKDPNVRCIGACWDPQKDQLQFVEREIRSGFRYSDLVPDGVGEPGELTRVLNFSRDDEGWSEPYTYCEAPRTYPLRGIDAGDYFGTGSGTATSEFRVVAAIATSDDQQPEDLELPDCDAEAAPPVALFDPSDRHPEEGRVVEFNDLSTGRVTDWAWDFGDGETSTEQNPSHTYEDNGSYDVTLTVTDATGRTDELTIGIDVRNALPEISADDVSVESEDDPISVEVRLTDPGKRDGAGLQLEAQWDTADPGLPSPVTTTVAAGATQRFELGTLPFGTYVLRLKVIDKDGGEATTLVQVSVGQAGTVEPDDEVDSEPAPRCDFGISLGIPENETIELLNAYRAASKLTPLYASPTLTKAAEEHAQWMVDNNTFSHIGAGDSTPGDRAIAAGYPREFGVGENLALTGPKALDAIFGWRNSPTHNANMIEPGWRAIGVARVVTPTRTYWVHVFGDTIDCPTEPPGFDASLASAPSPDESAGGPSGASRFRAWGPGGQEGEPLDAPVQDGVPMFRPGEKPFIPPDQPPIEFPPPPSGAPPPDATFTGLVVSAATPSTTAPLTITNRSTRNGQLVGATVEVDDGRAPANLAPGGTSTFSVVTPGPLTVSLSGVGGPTLERTLAVGGTPVLATVAYQGVTSGAERSVVTLRARVVAAGSGVAARAVTFGLGGLSVSAVTGTDGIAEARLGLTVAPGSYTLRVDVAATDRDPAVSTTAGFLVEAHTPPVADAGGPYTPLLLDALTLDASASQASVPGTLRGDWDLDADGDYDDADGLVPTIGWSEVTTKICGGTCSKDRSYPVAVQITDPRGSVDTDATTVTFTSTYAIAVDPPTATLNPGGASSFTVSVVSQSGWTAPVRLSVPNLPVGMTATFATNDVVPNAAVTLTLSAAANVAAADIDFIVRAESQGVVRETARSIDLEFGLVPVCYGVIAGIVLDAETGAPVPNASILGASLAAGADGRFRFDRVLLGNGNQPVSFFISAVAIGYFNAPFTREVVGCGNPVDVTLRITRQQSSAMTGVVVEGIPDPFDRSPNRRVTPTTTPIADATLFANSAAPNGQLTVTSAADGAYRLDPLRMGVGNLPTNYSVDVSKLGYWRANTSATLSPGSPVQQSFSLVKICYGAVDIRVVDEVTRRPIGGANARVGAETGEITGITDENGRVRLERVPLGYNNSTVTRFLSVSKLVNGRFVGVQATVQLPTCGATGVVDMALRTPTENRGSVTGRVVDEETGAPLAGMTVRVNGAPSSTVTDPDGRYRFDNVLIGYDQTTTVLVGVDAIDNRSVVVDRYEASRTALVTLRTGETVAVADLTMLRIRRGTIIGVVLDAVTGAPIAGAAVTGGGELRTPADGTFRLDNVELGPRNTPRLTFLTATRPDYWFANVSTTVTADTTATVEIRLLRMCAPASVRGRVINAVTKEPLELAGVQYGPSGSEVVFTDALGRYEVPSIVVPQNRPFETTLRAYKEGFQIQTRSATIQCGARLTVDFAGPLVSSAAVIGTVTDEETGTPIAGASVLGEWGGSSVTAADGTYRIANVPLADDGTSRAWEVSVQPPVLSPLAGQRRTVTVAPATETRADFALRGPTNQPPVAQSRTITARPGESGRVSLEASDPEGAPLRFYPVGTVPSWVTFSFTGSRQFDEFFFTAPSDGTRSATVQFVATDGQADSNVGTITILIPATAPVAVIAPVGPLNEGDTATLDGRSSTPSPGATITAYEWDLDSDGVYDDATGARPQYTFPNDGIRPVRLRVTDSAGFTATTSRDVVVFNVLPVVDAGPDVTIGPDGVFSRTVTFTDPGDDTWTAFVDWDGPGTATPDIIPLTTRSFAISHTFPGPGTYPVSVRVCEGFQVCGEDSFVVTVPTGTGNQPPTARIAPAGPAPEGSVISFDGSGSTDSDGTIVAYEWDLDGDGAFDDAVGATTQRAFGNDGSFEVGLRVTDDDGATAQTTRTVVITNVTPTVDLGPDVTIERGDELARTATIVDPGDDELTATLDLGEGDGPEAVTVAGRSFDWSHAYTTAGVYTIRAEVCDEVGCGTDTLVVTVLGPPPPDPVADLSITKTRAVALVAGATTSYTIEVTNLGPDSTSGAITVTDPVPTGLAGVLASGPGWACSVSSGTLSCVRTESIESGTSASIAVTAAVVAEAGATITNTATVTSLYDPEPTNDQASDTGTVEAPPPTAADLVVSIEGPSAAEVGDLLTWVVDVTNAGPDDSGPISLTITGPTRGRDTGVAGSGWTCSSVVCSHPGLAAGQTASVTVTSTVADAGEVVLEARADGAAVDPDPTDNEASLITAVTTPTTTTTTSTTSTTTTSTTSTTTTSTTSTTSTTTTTTTSATSTTGTTAPVGVLGTATEADGDETAAGSLPRTGSDTGSFVFMALLLVLGGVALVLSSWSVRRARNRGPGSTSG